MLLDSSGSGIVLYFSPAIDRLSNFKATSRRAGLCLATCDLTASRFAFALVPRQLTIKASLEPCVKMASGVAANDKEHPCELKELNATPAWIDCPYCRSRALTRVVKATDRKSG
jgi:hypothetical protein